MRYGSCVRSLFVVGAAFGLSAPASPADLFCPDAGAITEKEASDPDLPGITVIAYGAENAAGKWEGSNPTGKLGDRYKLSFLAATIDNGTVYCDYYDRYRVGQSEVRISLVSTEKFAPTNATSWAMVTAGAKTVAYCHVTAPNEHPETPKEAATLCPFRKS
ncbi:hypothetical protein SAMN02800692_3646 [Luteibacter sp. UNC138MFCol5.1]|nr:hypothetical protein SAMN02800692_3646 [Luteibacter sp. UNC138MFCol5.1]